MRLYDALWALAAADLKTSLENREFGHVSAATTRLEKAGATPKGNAPAITWQEWKAPRADESSE